MKEATYRKDESKYLKLITQAMGKTIAIGRFTGKLWLWEKSWEKEFSPEHNAEQRIECQDFYRERLKISFFAPHKRNCNTMHKLVWSATESPIALILAILDLIGVEDENI